MVRKLKSAGFPVPSLVLGILFISAGICYAQDPLSACRQESAPLRTQIKCDLWELTAFSRREKAGTDFRTTGPVALGPDRWMEALVPSRVLGSTWPSEIRLLFYFESRLVEEIRDQNLDGLDSNQPGDAYFRYRDQNNPARLLREIDSKLIEPMNREYHERIKEVLRLLNARTRIHGPLNWQSLSPGLETARLRAYAYIRHGSPELILLRLDPNRYDLVPFSHLEKGSRPDDIEDWAERLPQAAAVFNAGQYYPDKRYIGLLIKNGHNFGSSLHRGWKAIIASGGKDKTRNTRIVDLELEAFDPDKSEYPHMAQSFMLLDRRGRPRVRQSSRQASRTFIAQDAKGRIIIGLAPGALTLYELVLLLKKSDLGLVKAMNLDGGFQSQMSIRYAGGLKSYYGAWVISEKGQYHNLGLKLSIPAVIGVVPR